MYTENQHFCTQILTKNRSIVKIFSNIYKSSNHILYIKYIKIFFTTHIVYNIICQSNPLFLSIHKLLINLSIIVIIKVKYTCFVNVLKYFTIFPDKQFLVSRPSERQLRSVTNMHCSVEWVWAHCRPFVMFLVPQTHFSDEQTQIV